MHQNIFMRVGRIFLAIMFFLAGAAMLFAQTNRGQTALLRIAEYALASEDFALTIGAIEGSLFSSARIDHISLRDHNGIWLSFSGVRIVWSPLSFLAGQLNIDQILVDRVAVVRRPEPSLEKSQSSDRRVPAIGVKINKLEISEIDLATPVLGIEARFTALAALKMVDVDQGIDAMVKVNRIDGADGRLDANLIYKPNKNLLDANIYGAESEGGLVARLLNFEALPALRLTFTGQGPLENWRGDLSLQANNNPFVVGHATVKQSKDNRKFALSLDGYLKPLVPSQAAALLPERTTATIEGYISDEGLISLQKAELNSDALSIAARGEADIRKVKVNGEVSIRISRNDHMPVSIPTDGHDHLLINKANLYISVSADHVSQPVSINVDIQGLESSIGKIDRLNLSGQALQQKPSGKGLWQLENFLVEGSAYGIKPRDTKFLPVIGPSVTWAARGRATHDRVELTQANLKFGGGILNASGAIKYDDMPHFEGKIDLRSTDLAVYAEMVANPLKGSARLGIKGTIPFSGDELNVTITGEANNVATGTSALDRLLAAKITLSGRIQQAKQTGIILNNVRLKNDRILTELQGFIRPSETKLTAFAEIQNISAFSPSLSGGLKIRSNLEGKTSSTSISISLLEADLKINGTPLEAPSLSLDTIGTRAQQSGELNLQAQYEGQDLRVYSNIWFTEKGFFGLKGLDASFAGASLKGDISKSADQKAQGSVKLQIPNLKSFETLVATPLAGQVSALLRLSKKDGDGTDFTLRANGKGIKVGDLSVSTLNADVSLANLETKAEAQGVANLIGVKFGKTYVPSFKIAAKAEDDGTLVFVDTAFNKAKIRASGLVGIREKSIVVDLKTATITQSGLNARLNEPSRISILKRDIEIGRIRVAAADGWVEISGNLAKSVDLSVVFNKLPANLANVFVPDIGVVGWIKGEVRVVGTTALPKVTYNLTWKKASASAASEFSLPPLTIFTKGTFVDQRLNLTSQITGTRELDLTVSGDIFLRDNILFDLKAKGRMPLSFANATLATRGMRAAGILMADLKLTGSAKDPILSGLASTKGSEFSDASNGVALREVLLIARFAKRSLFIEQLSARSKYGGKLNATGQLGLQIENKFPTDLKIRVDQFKFNDKKTVLGEIDGTFKLEGNLLASLKAKGKLFVRRMDIFVPSSLPHTIEKFDVKHKNIPEENTIAQIKNVPSKEMGVEQNINIDIFVQAAQRVFIHGRGIEAQLGGNLSLVGNVERPNVKGKFKLIRGVFSILGRQLNFKRGYIVFTGSLDPYLDFSADSNAGNVLVTVEVTGVASSPKFKFSSIPELPEDEVLALLLFNKELAKLSPIQLAQLATEVHKISGFFTGPRILDNLKNSVGIDVLDVTTEKFGDATVKAGSYIDEKIYIGAERAIQGTSGRVIIDLDLTNNLKARGEVGSDGSSKLGIGMEWDY